MNGEEHPVNSQSCESKQQIEADGQIKLQQLIKALPDETPKPEWRSRLTDKIAKEAVRRKRRHTAALVMKSSLGFALAACCAFAVFIQTGKRNAAAEVKQLSPQASMNLESSLLHVHEVTDTTNDVVGSGLNDTSLAAAVDSNEWPQEDSNQL